MDGDRTRYGALMALLGFIGGYLAAYWQGRRDRRALTLLRLVKRGTDAQAHEDMVAQLEALDRKQAP